MALRLNTPLQLANGLEANFVRLGPFRVDHDAKEARARFVFYKDKATAARDNGRQPMAATHQVIKLELTGEAFDRHFGDAAIEAAIVAAIEATTGEPLAARAAAVADAVRVEAILYRAAKAEPDRTWSDFDVVAPDEPAGRRSVLFGARKT